MTTTTVSVPCPFCHTHSTVEVPLDGFIAWRNGELIQNALPALSADDRELLISGVCPSCWDTMPFDLEIIEK